MVATKKNSFFGSEEAAEIKEALQSMVRDSAYFTEPSYSPNSKLYPDNLMPFVDKHMNYLNAHPDLNPKHYMSNLRLRTRIR